MVFDSLQEEMVRSYVRSAVATNSTYQNTKWVPWRFRQRGPGAPSRVNVAGWKIHQLQTIFPAVNFHL